MHNNLNVAAAGGHGFAGHMNATLRSRPGRIVMILLVALLGVGALLVVNPTPVHAAPKVTITGTPDPDKETKLKLKGTGFQSVKNGFGGIYVLFGTTLAKNWQPSKGGKTGEDYRYQYDNEEKPAGYQVFVTFPGSSTADAANGGQLKADGTWSATIRVAGTKFKSYDRDNNEVDVDCAKTGCGVMTIGAHGVVNPSNESYTAVDFKSGSAATTAKGSKGSKSSGSSGKSSGTTGSSGSTGSSGNSGGGNSGTTGDAGTGNGTVVTGNSQPIVDADGVNQITGKMSSLFFAILIAVIAGAILVALAVGIGSYLATQSLLLGVNPEALERVRGRRAKRAVAAAEKQKRKVAKYQSKQERRTRKVVQSGDAHVARADMKADYAAAEVWEREQAKSGGSAYADPSADYVGNAGSTAGPMSFFERLANNNGDGGTQPGAGNSASVDGSAGEADETRPLATVSAGGQAGDGEQNSATSLMNTTEGRH